MGLFSLISSGPQVTMPGPLPAFVAPAGQHTNLDVRLLGGLVQSLYAKSIADSTRSAYLTAQVRYLTFCSNFGISPLPLSEYSLCLFSAYLANQGLQARTISAYLSGLRYLQISSGLQAPALSPWPWLHYVTRGIKRSQPPKDSVRLPITLSVMQKLKQVWLGKELDLASYKNHLLWALDCTAFFCFLRLGKVFPPAGNCIPPLLSDLEIDSHSDPSYFRSLIRRAKNDPFGKGSFVFLGKQTRTSAQLKHSRVTSQPTLQATGPCS